VLAVAPARDAGRRATDLAIRAQQAEAGERARVSRSRSQPGVQVLGRRVAEGTSAPLALWKTSDSVRVADVASADELARAACSVDESQTRSSGLQNTRRP
jgi:hypothetical protein